jgi:hypothetical protein
MPLEAAALVARGEYFGHGNRSGVLAEGADLVDGGFDFRPSAAASGTSRAIGRPSRVMTMVSPRSTSSSN